MDDLRGLGNLLREDDDRSDGSNASENGQEKPYFGPNEDSTHGADDRYYDSDNGGNLYSSGSEPEEEEGEDEDDVDGKAGDGRASGDATGVVKNINKKKKKKDTTATTPAPPPPAPTSGLRFMLAKDATNAEVNAAFVEKSKTGGTTASASEIAQTSDLYTFMAMINKRSHLTLVHSVAPFNSLRVPDKSELGWYGFVGENSSTATALDITPSWINTKAKKKMPSDQNALANADPAVLWKGYENLDTAALTEVSMLHMPLLFPAFAEYLASNDKTPLQAREWLTDYIAKHSLTAGDYKHYIDFLEMAACEKNGKSVMSLAMAPRLALQDPTKTWIKTRLEGTLGAPPSPPRAGAKSTKPKAKEGTSKDVQTLVTNVTAFVQSVEKLATAQKSSSTKAKITQWSRRKWFQAASVGGVFAPTQLPAVWAALLRASTHDEAHEIWTEKVKAAMDDLGILHCQPPVILKMESQSLLALNLVPEEPISFDNKGTGALTWMGCLPRSQKAIEDARDHEATMEKMSEQAITYETRLALQRREKNKDGKVPTIDGRVFMNTLVIYTVKHSQAWGKKNNHAKACWALHKAISTAAPGVQDKLLGPRQLLILQWLIMRDHHQYYQSKKSEEALRRGELPKSQLWTTVDQVNSEHIPMPLSFPTEWASLVSARQAPRDLPGPPSHPTLGELGDLMMPDAPPPVFGPPAPPVADPLRTGKWHDDVHPSLKELSKKVKDHVGEAGSIPFLKARKACKMSWQDFPQCNVTDDNGRKNLCLKFLLGRCDSQTCNLVHVRAKHLPTEIAEQLQVPMTKIVDKIVSTPRKGKGKRKRPPTESESTVTFSE
mmetsp:Transcript_23272/g.53419  ORF Transcript_23272/g.53419 Transcript_23272/m.53419 type:complete len:833 (-) Transcript_23272:361-2859(-)